MLKRIDEQLLNRNFFTDKNLNLNVINSLRCKNLIKTLNATSSL